MLQKISVVAGVIGGCSGTDIARKTPSAKPLPRKSPASDGKKGSGNIRGSAKGSKDVPGHSSPASPHANDHKASAAVKRMPLKKHPAPRFSEKAPCSQSQPNIEHHPVPDVQEVEEDDKETAQDDDADAENMREVRPKLALCFPAAPRLSIWAHPEVPLS